MKHCFSASAAALPLGAAALGGGALVYLAAVLLAGGGPAAGAHFLLFLLAFGVCLLGTGLFCVRLLAPGLSGADSWAAAFLPGCACLFAGYALIWGLGALLPFLRTGTGWYLMPCWLLGGYEWLHRLRTRQGLPGRHKGSLALVLLAGTLGLVWAVTAVWGVLPAAGTDQLRAWTYNQDQLWSVGNAAAVRFGLPLQDMRVAGATLHYHFLNDVTAGLLSLGTGASAWAGLCWYWNFPVAAWAVVGLYCIGRRFAPRARALAALVPAAVFFCSAATSTLPTSLFTNANAQATALAALCAGLVLLLHAPLRPARGAGVRWACLCVVCGLSLSLLKSTIGMLLVLAVASAALVGAVTRQTRPGHWLTLAGLAAGFGLAYLFVLRLATNNLVFTTLANLKNLPEAYPHYLALPLLVLYGAGLVWSAVHLPRLEVPVLAVNAFSIGGMLAYVLYNHYSFSQVYFALAAVPCALLATLPAGQALALRLAGAGRTLPRRLAAGALALALAACAGSEFYYNQSYLRSGAQAALRCIGRPAFEPAETRMTDGDWDAALWLKENTPVDTVFATNRNNKQFDAAEGTFHFYTAVSERRCYLESYRYGMDYDRAYYEIRRRLEEVSDAIFYRLDEADAFALAKQEGIDYLLVSLLVPDAPEWEAAPVYENQYVRLYAVS